MCMLCLRDGIGVDLWSQAHRSERDRLKLRAAALKARIREMEIMNDKARSDGRAPPVADATLDLLRNEQYELARKL